VQNALTVYYEDVVHSLLDALKENLSAARRLPRLENPIPLVLSGGTVMPRGFFEFFKKVLATCELPVRLSEVRMSAEPLYSTARGALMAASVS
jgi:activator of 2-hydroxyglutaryl-CoA dehydratase